MIISRKGYLKLVNRISQLESEMVMVRSLVTLMNMRNNELDEALKPILKKKGTK